MAKRNPYPEEKVLVHPKGEASSDLDHDDTGSSFLRVTVTERDFIALADTYSRENPTLPIPWDDLCWAVACLRASEEIARQRGEEPTGKIPDGCRVYRIMQSREYFMKKNDYGSAVEFEFVYG